jgi:hypothetical protein
MRINLIDDFGAAQVGAVYLPIWTVHCQEITLVHDSCQEGAAVLRWTQSTDNLDPQFTIRYEIYVNGIFRPESTMIGYGNTIAYAVVDGFNTFEVIAVDSAGNRSAPTSITLCMAAVC